MYNDAYAVLEELYNKHGLKMFPSSEFDEYTEERMQAVQWLYQMDYLYVNGVPDGVACVRPDGRNAYLEERLARKDQEQEKAQKEAERREERSYADKQTKKHFRHDWWITIVSALCSFIIGATAEYFIDIVGNAVRLWSLFLEKFQ